MAKKKTRKTHKAGKRRKVGAIGGDTTQMLLGTVLGAVGGRYLSNSSLVPASITPTIKNLAMLAGGALLVMKSKKPMLRGVGAGLLASGAIGEGVAFGFLSGIDDGTINFSPSRNLAAAANMRTVGAASNNFPQPSVVGFPDVHVVGGMY